MLKMFCRVFLGVLCSGIAIAQTPPLAITNVTVIDATGQAPQAAMTVLIENGRITKLFRTHRAKFPANTQIVAGDGKFLIPGLWDMHLHLTNQPNQELSREWSLPLLVAYGVVGVRDMGGDWQRMQQLRNDIATGKTTGPRIIAPGPFIDGPGFVEKPVKTGDEARQQVRELKTSGVDFLKVQANLSPETYRAVLAEAKQLRMIVAGHVPEAISAFEVARAGQRSIEHSSPILPGDGGILLSCSSQEDELRAELLAIKREAEAPKANRQQLRLRQRTLQMQMLDTYDARKCQSLFALLKQHHVWVVPTQIWAQRLLPLSADDGMNTHAQSWLPRQTATRFAGRRSEGIKVTAPESFALRTRIAEQTRALVTAMYRAGVPLLAGTDALDGDVIPGLSLHQELELMVQAGMTPMEALQTATRNAAQYFDATKSRGTIVVGKQADLVLLDANPLENIRNTQKIHAVILQGRLLSAPQRQTVLEQIKRYAEAH